MHRIRIPLGYNFRHTFVRYTWHPSSASERRRGQWRSNCVGMVGKVEGPPSAPGPPEFQANYFSQLFMLCGRLVHVGETLNRFSDFEL